MTDFSHIDDKGNVKMVDVTDKLTSVRYAKAEGDIFLQEGTLHAIRDSVVPKGDVLTTAKIAGIMAAKKTAGLIPMCHPVNLTNVEIQFRLKPDRITISANARAKDATGIEMEALTAVSIAALTIYDMCKSVDTKMTIANIRLLEKKGGKSHHQTDFRPRSGVLVLSDSISAGSGKDRSGVILKTGLEESGCAVLQYKIIPDDKGILVETIREWQEDKIELIITSGGTGVGPRDITIQTLESEFDQRLPGVEQALHAYGLGKIKTAMLSRLAVGVIGHTIVICLPGSTGAAKDALNVLIPTIFHAYDMQLGKKHDENN